MDGDRIVNITYFIDQCKHIALYDIKCTMGKMQFKHERRTGIVSCFHYYCNSCEETMKIYSHPPKTSATVNKMLVWVSNSIGTGYSQTVELFNVINTPIMSDNYYRIIENKIRNQWAEILQNQILQAAQEEKALASEV